MKILQGLSIASSALVSLSLIEFLSRKKTKTKKKKGSISKDNKKLITNISWSLISILGVSLNSSLIQKTIKIKGEESKTNKSIKKIVKYSIIILSIIINFWIIFIFFFIFLVQLWMQLENKKIKKLINLKTLKKVVI